MDYEKYRELGKKLGDNSSAYLSYIDYLSNESNLQESSIKDYLDKVKLFLEKYPLKFIEIRNIEEYIQSLNSDSYKTSNAYAILSFFSYYEKYNKIPFASSEIKKFSIPQNQMNKDNKEDPLSIDEIIELRKSLSKYKKYKLSFIFELVYAYGLSLGELLKCTNKNYDLETNTFLFEKRSIHINEFIQNLIAEQPSVLEKMSKSSYQNYFNDMGSLINRPVKYTDVKASNKKYGMKCMNCQKEYLSERQYWRLAHHENDAETLYLVCRECGE